MSVFVDTGVFYAHHDTDATRHEAGRDALNAVLRGSTYGRTVTSDYVYDEAVTLTHARTGRIDDAITLGRRIRGEGYPDVISLLHGSARRFEDAVAVYERYDDHDLSFTDAMSIAMVQYHDVDALLSFDDDFDGIVDRLAPATVVDS
jgi:Predicted nucleic acid-binding protein, contains PIN domain